MGDGLKALLSQGIQNPLISPYSQYHLPHLVRHCFIEIENCGDETVQSNTLVLNKVS